MRANRTQAFGNPLAPATNPRAPVGLETEAEHTTAFNDSLGRTIGEIVYRGRVCVSAKAKFPGRYQSWLRETLHCSKSYAFKCRTIAEHPFLAEVSNWKSLPSSTAALYELSGLPEARLQALVNSGEINCKLTIHEAIALAEMEAGDYRPLRQTLAAMIQRERNSISPGEIDEIALASVSDASDGVNGEIDFDRLLIAAESVDEAFQQVFARCRRRIEAIGTLASPAAKNMLAAGLREISASLSAEADALELATAEENGDVGGSTRLSDDIDGREILSVSNDNFDNPAPSTSRQRSSRHRQISTAQSPDGRKTEAKQTRR